jgi:predicted nucleotidyltransferase
MLRANFVALFKALRNRGVEFILVGGLAAVIEGAPINTFDVDVVHARDEENVERLLHALNELDAIFRTQPDRRLKPSVSHLSGTGHLNLVTRHGPLDVLGTIGTGLDYDELLPHSIETDIGEGLRIRVLDLETVIAVKEQLGTDKDRAVLPILKRTLEEKRRRTN